MTISESKQGVVTIVQAQGRLDATSASETDRRLAAIVVSHHLNLAARFADRLVLLHQGRVVATGAPEGVLETGRLQGVFGWPVALQRLPDGTVQLYPERRAAAPGDAG